MEKGIKFWNQISNIGITPVISSIERSKIVLSNRVVALTILLDILSLMSYFFLPTFRPMEILGILTVTGAKITYFIFRHKQFHQLAPLLMYFVFTIITFVFSFSKTSPPNIEMLYIIAVFYLLIVFSDLWRCLLSTLWVVFLFVLSRYIQYNYLEFSALNGQPNFFLEVEIKAVLAFISTIFFSVLIIHWYLREVNNIQAKSNQYLEEIKHQNTSLAMINDEMKQFSYIASHDLKTPLRSVVSFLGIIEKKLHQKKYEDVDEYLTFAKEGAHQMYQLINDILEYSRLSSTESSKSLVDLNDTFYSVQKQMHQISDQYNIHKKNELPTLLANKAKMNALFQNLIENGLKYNENKNPKIEIQSNETTDELVLEFKDNGIGIDPVYKTRIFEMFKRLHNKDQYSGSGIGLAICKKIVESMNGEIEIDTNIQGGSLFVIKLPK